MSKKKIRRPQQYRKPKERTMKEWWQNQKESTRKGILWGTISVVAVIALLLVYYYGIYDDGSLRIRNNAAVGAQENWLIGRRSSGKNSEYYHLADVAAPEGYTVGEGSATSPLQSFSYEKDGIRVDVLGGNGSAESLADTASKYLSAMVGEEGTISDVSDRQGKLGACKYYIYTMSSATDDGGTEYRKSAALYAPCSYEDACILISSSMTTANKEELPEDDLLMSAIDNMMDYITLVE